MKKILTVILISIALFGLTGCEGNVTHTNVKVVDKFRANNGSVQYMVKIEDSGQSYVYRVDSEDYGDAQVGEKIDLRYNDFRGRASIKPAE